MKQRVRCTDRTCESKCRAVIKKFDDIPHACIYSGITVQWEKYEKLKAEKTDLVDDAYKLIKALVDTI